MATKKKPKKKKGLSLKEQAKQLTDAQYAGVLSELNTTKSNNIKQYDRYASQRQTSLSRELGSNTQTGEIVQNAIAGRKGVAIAAAKDAYTKQELSRTLRDQANQAENTNALSNYEAMMKSRGLSPEQSADMATQFNSQKSLTSQLDDINRKSSADTELAAGTAMDTLATQAQMANFNAQANARGNAQRDFNTQYTNTLTENEKLAGELAKTKLDKGNSQLNTYLTLKKEYQQRKAEEAQSRLEAAVAMGKQASSDYFREAKLNLDTTKAANTQGNKDREFELKKQDTIAKWTKDAKKGTLDEAKFAAYIKKNGISLKDLPTSLKKYVNNYKYYNPRTGEITTSTS